MITDDDGETDDQPTAATNCQANPLCEHIQHFRGTEEQGHV